MTIEEITRVLEITPDRVMITANRYHLYFKDTSCSYSKDEIIRILLK